MAEPVDPREVLTYLNDLGYTNINTQQLKEFIIDLKKLMKYDQRKYNRNNIENHADLPKRGNNCYICDTNEANIFNTLYNQSTVASKAKEVPKKTQQISVHITKSKQMNRQSEPPTEVEVRSHSSPTRSKNDLNFVAPVNSKVTLKSESTVKSARASSRQSADTKKSKTSSGSRPSTSKMVNKSDPVALYHHYQAQWTKQKVPGQDNRANLRWAIREKMMNGPKVECGSSRRINR